MGNIMELMTGVKVLITAAIHVPLVTGTTPTKVMAQAIMRVGGTGHHSFNPQTMMTCPYLVDPREVIPSHTTTNAS